MANPPPNGAGLRRMKADRRDDPGKVLAAGGNWGKPRKQPAGVELAGRDVGRIYQWLKFGLR